MAAILADAYAAAFVARPKYMTDYNGATVVPGSPGYDPNLDSGARGAMYYPLVRWEQLTDAGSVSARYAAKVKDAYELGLIRSEHGIARGRMVNGRMDVHRMRWIIKRMWRRRYGRRCRNEK